jgi:hypothetical protein
MKDFLQFSRADHVAYEQKMSMSTNTQEYSRNSKHFKHLLTAIRSRRFPPVNTWIGTFLETVNFINIKPCNIVLEVWIVTKAFLLGIKSFFISLNNMLNAPFAGPPTPWSRP